MPDDETKWIKAGDFLATGVKASDYAVTGDIASTWRLLEPNSYPQVSVKRFPISDGRHLQILVE